MFLGNGPAGPSTLNIRKTRSSRPALRGPRGMGTQTCRDPSLNSTYPARGPIPFARTASPPNSQLRVLEQDSKPHSSLTESYPHILDAPARQPSPGRSMLHGSSTRAVLCPYVSVTAECTALEADQQSVWAAVEVSGRLSQIPLEHTGAVTGSVLDHELGDSDFSFRQK